MKTIPFTTRTETDKWACAQSDTAELVKKLVRFPELAHLRDAKIRVIYSKKERKSKGRKILGTAKPFSEKDRLLHGWEFLITLDAEFWEKSPAKREPLMFHELLHCGYTDKDQPTGVGHDLEEFGAVVARYGAWKHDVHEFREQLELFDQNQLRKESAAQ